MTPREVMPRRTPMQRVVVGFLLGIASGLVALWSQPDGSTTSRTSKAGN